MHFGSRLVAVGLLVVLVAIVFEYLSLRLGGLSVGFGLVAVGLLLLAARETNDEPSSDGANCDDCGAATAPDASECEYCGAAL